MTAARAGFSFIAAFLGLAGAPALAEDSIFDALGRATGVISPPPNPPDFVRNSRSAKPTEEIPAFSTPEEPRSRVKTPAELKAMDADLERAKGGQGKPKRRAASK